MPDSSVRDSSSRKRHPPSLNKWRSAQDFRRKGDGAKYNKALPEEASPDAFGHHPIISGLLEEHLSDPRTSSLSEVSSLPHVPPDLEAFPYDLSPSHRWTYPSVRRLLRLAHATANRPNDAPYFRDVPVSEKKRKLLFEWRPLLKVHDGFRTEEENNILASRRLLRRAFGLDPKPQTGQFPQDRHCLIN